MAPTVRPGAAPPGPDTRTKRAGRRHRGGGCTEWADPTGPDSAGRGGEFRLSVEAGTGEPDVGARCSLRRSRTMGATAPER
ncbi:hypothetical protein GCM10010505_24220 [Kitasatospora aburaviensis]